MLKAIVAGTGGVVGGVVGAALIALAGFLFAQRYQTKARVAEASHGMDIKLSNTSFKEVEGGSDWPDGGFLGPQIAQGNTLSALLLGDHVGSLANSQSSADIPSGPLPPSRGLGSPMSGIDSTEWYIDPTSLTVCRHPDGTPWKLGQGGFGSVYKALQDNVRFVAVKISEKGTDRRQDEAFWQEVEIIANCRDRNILQFYGAAVHGPEVLLVTEYCERGDLYHAIGAQTGEHIDGELCWHRRGQGIALDIARGLFSLHSQRIVHFDVKSPNVLLTREYLAKIADVGLAHPLASRSRLIQPNTMKGTWAWQAPETITGADVTTAADIWSFGVIMWELMTGEQPRRGAYRTPRVPEEGPVAAVKLIDACMQKDSALRPTATQLITKLEKMQQH
ncbi:hypothetical protein WJX73_000926 [Symbiochloris irregularis]|uniref:Protein kinase domain-containing protein n=1 Tax=Symbiochloris irregularis TaxID=706552 RepID=A0AAW1PV76_9CHLO